MFEHKGMNYPYQSKTRDTIKPILNRGPMLRLCIYLILALSILTSLLALTCAGLYSSTAAFAAEQQSPQDTQKMQEAQDAQNAPDRQESQIELDYGRYALPSSQASGSNFIGIKLSSPASQPAYQAVRASLDYYADDKTQMVYTELSLFNESKKQLAFETHYQQSSALGYNNLTKELSPKNPQLLSPGVYEIKLRVVYQYEGSIKVYQAQHSIYLYDSSKAALPTSLAVRLSLPPLYDYESKTLNKELLEASLPKIKQLKALLDELSQHPEETITLSIPYGSLKDIAQAAYDPKEEHANLFRQIYLQLQDLSLHQINLVYAGYNDPDLSLMYLSENLDQLSAQYQEGSIEDGRDEMPLTIQQGAIPSNLSLPEGSVEALNLAGVQWLVSLPEGLSLNEDQSQEASALYASEKHPKFRIIQAYKEFLRQLEQDSSLNLNEILLIQHEKEAGQDENRLFCGIYPLQGDDKSFSNFIKMLRFCSQQAWLQLESCQDLVDQLSPKTGIAGVYKPQSVELELEQSMKEAGSALNSLEAASGHKLDNYKRAYMQLVYAQSSAWLQGDELLKNHAQDHAQKALDLVQQVYSGLSITSQNIHLSGNSGEVPVILLNSNNDELKLRLHAIGNEYLDVDPKFVKGIVAGTLAGENYVSIPVKLKDKSIHNYGLTVEVFAGDKLLTSKYIEVIASRTDLIVILLVALAILLILLFRLRSRLRKAGLTQAFDNTAEPSLVGTVIEEIKEELDKEVMRSSDDNPEGPVHEAGLSPRFYTHHGKHVIFAGDPLDADKPEPERTQQAEDKSEPERAEQAEDKSEPAEIGRAPEEQEEKRG